MLGSPQQYPRREAAVAVAVAVRVGVASARALPWLCQRGRVAETWWAPPLTTVTAMVTCATMTRLAAAVSTTATTMKVKTQAPRLGKLCLMTLPANGITIKLWLLVNFLLQH